jgi:hypothetical protein
MPDDDVAAREGSEPDLTCSIRPPESLHREDITPKGTHNN